MTGGRHPHPEALYYHTAGDALAAAKIETDPFRKAELVSTCMVFSALCLEAYINQAFYNFAETRKVKVMEDNDRLPLESKWLMLPLLMGAPKTFDTSVQPYQTFNDLIKTRNNRLVHFKPSSERDTSKKPIKKTYFSELVSDVSLAEKYWRCVAEMINELHVLTSGKTELPNFLKGSRYTSRVWSEFRFTI
jgi:hypothetical protein